VGNMGLVTEAESAVTAGTRCDQDAGVVVEHTAIVDESEPYER
jgi:hypothetical protein